MHRLRNIELDLDSWPVVYVRYGAFDEAEHAIHFDIVLGEILKREGPFGIVVNVNDAPMLTPIQRKRVVDGWNDNGELFQTRLKALTYVTDSTLKRGVITAINWFVNFPCPTQVHSNDDEAITWVRSQHI